MAMRGRSRRARRHKEEAESPLGLVLSAGGARGAYQVGCWRAFLDRGLTFGAVAGSSIGALNGAFVAQGDWRSAHDLWMELTRTTIIKPEYERLRKLLSAAAWDLGLLLLPVPNFRVLRLLKYASAALRFHSERGALGVLRDYGLLNIAAFKPLLEKHLDVPRILHQSTPLFVAVNGSAAATNPLGQPFWFKLQDLAEDEAWSVLAASMALPLVFSPIEIRGARYMDGGIGQWLPVKPLYDSGVRRMIAISLKASFTINPEEYPGLNVLLIKPDRPLGRFPAATFRFTDKAVTEWMEQGYVDASRTLERHPLPGP
jgi:NTE family protein